jgi:hypothetical protein
LIVDGFQSHQSGGADLSSHGLSVLTVEELLLHCVVSDIIDFIIKQVSRTTRPMTADDEGYSLT